MVMFTPLNNVAMPSVICSKAMMAKRCMVVSFFPLNSVA